MDGRFLITLMLLISGSTKFAFSLHCFTCDGFSSCENPEPEYCDAESSIATRLKLGYTYPNASYMDDTEFVCMDGYLGLNNTMERAVSGCIVIGPSNCFHQPEVDADCRFCKRDLCNSAAANTFSYLALVFAALVFHKIFNTA